MSFLCLCFWPGCLCPPVPWSPDSEGFETEPCGQWQYRDDCTAQYPITFYDNRIDANTATRCCNVLCWEYIGSTCIRYNWFGGCADRDYNLARQITSVPAGQYRSQRTATAADFAETKAYTKCFLANCPGCVAGQYRSACGGAASMSRIGPGPCSNCASGQYKTSTGSGMCSSCSARANACNAGQWLAGCGGASSGTCTNCAGCPANQYRADCDGQDPGHCEDCATTCEIGKYLLGCSGTSAGRCTNCRTGKYKATTGTAVSECLTCALSLIHI